MDAVRDSFSSRLAYFVVSVIDEMHARCTRKKTCHFSPETMKAIGPISVFGRNWFPGLRFVHRRLGVGLGLRERAGTERDAAAF